MFGLDPRLHLSRISLAVFVLLLFGGVSVTSAQTPEAPVGADASEEGRWVEVEVPVEEVNRARKAAGREPIQAKAGGTVTMRYQQPVEREGGFKQKIASTFEPIFSVPPSSSEPAKKTDGSRVIEGLNINESFNIPADPHGAVGTNYICHVVNTAIQCFDKSDDSSVKNKGLDSFFSHDSGDKLFDPRVVYDSRKDRWVVLALNVVDDGTASNNTSEIFLAASQSNDPSGSWNRQTIDVKQTIDNSECWFDYPGFAVDEDAVYVTGNYFEFESEAQRPSYCDTYLAIFDKSNVYSGSVSDPPPYLDDPNEGFSRDYDATLQPASISGTTPDSKVGTWVIQYSGLSDGDEFWMVTRVDYPLGQGGTRSFTNNLISWGDVDSLGISPLTDAPQPDTSARIEVNDRDLLDLVWRADTLWGTTTVAPPSGNTNAEQTTAQYGQIDVSTLGSPSPTSNVNIGGEDIETGAYTYFPSVTVDANGNAAFGFSLSAPGTYAGAYLVARTSSGTLLDTRLARDGVDKYYRDFGGSRNRWGDYTAVELDPSDGSFWTINKVAISEGSCTSDGCGRWGTYLTKFPTSTALPVELADFNANRDGQAAVLTWETASETNNAGFRVEHQGPDGSTWTETAFVEGSGSTTSPQQYRHRIEQLDPGVHQFRLIQVDNDGAKTKKGLIDVSIRPEARYALQAPRPNPTTGDAQLRLSVRNEQTVRVSLYNTLGQKVRTLSHTTVKPSVPLPIQVEGRDLASGIYFVRVEGETFMTTRKLTIAQ